MNIAQIEARLAQLAELRKAAEARNNDVLATVLRENRSTSDDEAKTISDAQDEVRRLDNEVRALTATLTDLRAAEEAEGRASITTADTEREAAAAAVRAAGGAVVKDEPRTYEKWNVRTSYFADLISAERGVGPVDEARSRLARHAKETQVDSLEARTLAKRFGGADTEYRDLTRVDGAGGAFVPPAWMMSEYIDLLRAGRVTANLCRQMPLPGGTDSINIPKISTGTATAIQTADNAAVQETDLADTSVSAGVKTIAGQQDLAIQLIEQSPLNFDQIVFQDLIADYNQKLDVQVISGSNASGQVKGIRTISSVATVSYTDASPTVPELYPKLASAINTMATTRYLPPTAFIMHPRRWMWMLAALDSSNRPFVVPSAQGAYNALGAFGGTDAEGPVGSVLGTPVYADPNIPTTVGGGTEDVIIACRPDDYYLWEGPLRSRVLPEVLSGNLTVRLQVYAYVAFLPDRRPESTCIVSGTGLAAPTF